MLTPILQAGKLALSLAALGEAIGERSLLGGLDGVIKAVTSGEKIFDALTEEDRNILARMAADVGATLENSHLTETRREATADLLARNMPKEADLLAGNMSAPDIAAAMAAKLDATAQEKQDYQDILQTILSPHLRPKDTSELMLQELLRRTDASGDGEKLKDAGITEKAIIDLARRVAVDTEDLGQAWRELQNAMEIAVEFQRSGHTNSNHPDFVDNVIAKAANQAAEGHYDNAWHTIQKGRAEHKEGFKAQELKYLDGAEKVARLERNPDRVAEVIITRMEIEADRSADCETIRAVAIKIGDQGRDGGILFDQHVSISVASAAFARAKSSDEKAAALHTLGNSCQELGARTGGAFLLEAAVTAYQNALKEWTRGRVPLSWASTQNNLGNALSTLGERETGTARLEAAVTAYQNALKEWTRDRLPLDWAVTNYNLTGVELAFFDKTDDPKHLSAAREYLANAMEVFQEAGATHYIAVAEEQAAAIDARAKP